MPSIFNILVCTLALLVGVLIGEKYRKWKKDAIKRMTTNDDKGAAASLSDAAAPF